MEDTFIQGSSNLKAKGADPRNWGLAGIDLSEMDIEVQHLAFESYSDSQKCSNVWYILIV